MTRRAGPVDDGGMKCFALSTRRQPLSARSALTIPLAAPQLCLGDLTAGRNAVGEPYAAADCRPPSHGDATEDGGAGVDDDIVLDDGMAQPALDQGAGVVGRKAARAQGYRLVQAHALADHGGLADHDARAVVDEEAAADLCAGMDVDAGQRVGDLADLPR